MTEAIDDLAPEQRRVILEKLRRRGRPGTSTASTDADVVFEVTGGAPGERYSYRISVRGDGLAARRVLDEMRSQEDLQATERVDVALVQRVFRAADDAGLLSDAPPQMTENGAGLVPDSMVALLTVREGQAVRRVVMPAGAPTGGEVGLPGEASDVPLETPMQLPSAAASRLAPVLDALHRVEEELAPRG
jgi:hypothetical protein